MVNLFLYLDLIKILKSISTNKQKRQNYFLSLDCLYKLSFDICSSGNWELIPTISVISNSGLALAELPIPKGDGARIWI